MWPSHRELNRDAHAVEARVAALPRAMGVPSVSLLRHQPNSVMRSVHQVARTQKAALTRPVRHGGQMRETRIFNWCKISSTNRLGAAIIICAGSGVSVQAQLASL